MTHYNQLLKRVKEHVNDPVFQKPIKSDLLPKNGDTRIITKLSRLCQKS